MIDKDLADFYGVKTKRLNEQVKRNIERFPAHYMFQLTKEEQLLYDSLRSQIVTLKNLRSQIATSKKKEAIDILLTPSPSKAFPCSPQSSKAKPLFKQASRSLTLSLR